MHFLYCDVLFKEVPDEISLAFSVTGCPMKCKGCHSPELRKIGLGTELTPTVLRKYLEKYKGFITCVLFFGGEWHLDALLELIKITKQEHPSLKVCLYTGKVNPPLKLVETLDYLKTGPYIEELGGLESEKTNQKFYKVSKRGSQREDLTHLFHKKRKEETQYVHKLK